MLAVEPAVEQGVLAVVGVDPGLELGEPFLVEGQEGYLYTLHAGAFLRVEDAIIPVVKLDYNPFSVSLSYDVNISKLRTSSMGRGGFELGISYIGFVERKKGTSAINATLCPRF